MSPRPYPKDLPVLTSLRFFAAMVVVIHHFKYFTPFDPLRFTGFLHEGYLAVDFFFILSGFIMTHVYAPLWSAGRFSAGDFIVRRFARIYPLHFVTLFVVALMCLTPLHFGPVGRWPGEFPLGSFFANLLMVQSWGMEPGLTFNVPAWSIGAEWFAYLCFPILLPMVMRAGVRTLFWGAVAAFVWLWLASWSLQPARPFTTFSFDFAPLRIMPEFVLGIALYRWSNARAPVQWAGAGLAVCAVLAAALLHLRAPDLLLIPVFCLAIRLGADMARLPDAGAGWLSGARAVWLGDISYALYMVHYPVMVLVLSTARMAMAPEVYGLWFWPLAGLAVGVSVGVAGLFHRILEYPARRAVYRALRPLSMAGERSK